MRLSSTAGQLQSNVALDVVVVLPRVDPKLVLKNPILFGLLANKSPAPTIFVLET